MLRALSRWLRSPKSPRRVSPLRPVVETLEGRDLLSVSPVGAPHAGISDIVFSPGGKHLAYVATDNQTSEVIEDGRILGSGYQGAGDLLFSADGKHLAYVVGIGSSGQTEEVVEDGKLIGTYTDTPPAGDVGIIFSLPPVSALQFSPGGDHLAFLVNQGTGGGMAVVDGRAVGGTHASVSSLTYSPGGKHLVFVATDNGLSRLYEDGKAVGAPHFGVYDILFSPDGKHLAYVAYDNNMQEVVEDGRILGSGYQGASGLLFSADGKHLAFVATTGITYGATSSETQEVVEDGKLIGGAYTYTSPNGLFFFPQPPVGALQFSPGGDHLAFLVNQGTTGGGMAVVDGRAVGGAHASVSGLTYSPNGKHLAFVATDNGLSRLYEDGKAVGAPHFGVYDILFSPDGKHLAYVAYDNNMQEVVEDGRILGSGYQGASGLLFCADGKHLAYVVYAGANAQTAEVVEDGKLIGTYTDTPAPIVLPGGITFPGMWQPPVSALQFSPGGDHLAFLVNQGTGGGMAVVDGRAVGGTHASVSGLTYSPDGKHLAFVATDNNLSRLYEG